MRYRHLLVGIQTRSRGDKDPHDIFRPQFSLKSYEIPQGGILTDLLLVMNAGYWFGSWARVSPILLAALSSLPPPGELSLGSPQRDGHRAREPPARVTVAEEMHSNLAWC